MATLWYIYIYIFFKSILHSLHLALIPSPLYPWKKKPIGCGARREIQAHWKAAGELDEWNVYCRWEVKCPAWGSQNARGPSQNHYHQFSSKVERPLFIRLALRGCEFMLFSAVNPLQAGGRLHQVRDAALNSFCNTAVCSLTKLQQINPVLPPCLHTSRSPPLLCTISLIKNPTRWLISAFFFSWFDGKIIEIWNPANVFCTGGRKTLTLGHTV